MLHHSHSTNQHPAAPDNKKLRVSEARHNAEKHSLLTFIISLLGVTQSIYYLDKNVVKNNQFTPNCSPDACLPLPDILCELQIWLPQVTTTPRTPPRIGPSHGKLCGDFSKIPEVSCLIFACYNNDLTTLNHK